METSNDSRGLFCATHQCDSDSDSLPCETGPIVSTARGPSCYAHPTLLSSLFNTVLFPSIEKAGNCCSKLRQRTLQFGRIQKVSNVSLNCSLLHEAIIHAAGKHLALRRLRRIWKRHQSRLVLGHHSQDSIDSKRFLRPNGQHLLP
jgi:hypothetical protein